MEDNGNEVAIFGIVYYHLYAQSISNNAYKGNYDNEASN